MERVVEEKLNRMIMLITYTLTITLCLGLAVRLGVGQLNVVDVCLRLALYTIPTIVGTAVIKRMNKMHIFRYYILGINIVLLFMITSGGYGVFEFSITYTIFMLFFLYNDKKVDMLLYAGILISSIGGGCVQYLKGAYPEQLYWWNIVMLFIFTYIYRRVSKLLIEDTNLKNINIQNERSVQSDLIKEILEIGSSIDKNCGQVNALGNKIQKSSEAINAAIEHVAIGAEENTLSIQSQLEMTKSIQEYISDAEGEFEEIKNVVDFTNTCCSRTNSIIEGLNEKASNSNCISIETEAIMRELKNETTEISHITGLISTISKQTNLLSLNASIESARAGEYGKGFAVVADEIGQLSKQSQKLILDINEMIVRLEQKVDSTIAQVNTLSENSREQGELISNISQEFDNISSGMEKAVKSVDSADEKIKKVVTSNEKIVENIQNISSVSEESSAATQQAAGMSNANQELVEKTNSYIQELAVLARHMKSYKIED